MSRVEERLNEAASRQALVSTLEEAARHLSATGAPAAWRREVEELRDRIRAATKMVAVFGAFSAGKSSLINALLGEPVLVVSPNPTTAAVTQVAGRLPDGAQARVHFKTAAQVWEDVEQAMRFLSRPAADLEDALRQARAWKLLEFAPSARRHAAFVKAVAAGYAEVADRLGSVLPASREEVGRYTAQERYACFVQRVDLAEPAPILASGAVLVDTPGVDSIHRRHTDVAFGYMQAADAIVFVLYYTHAFSRADREFLRELGQVQDILGTDKLFVVINAVDLASDDEERAAVRERVLEELRRLGVRRPRVHEVSSQLALVALQWARHPEDPRFAGLLRQRLGLSEGDALPDAEQILAQSGIPALASDLTAFVDGQSLAIARDAVGRLLRTRAADVRRTVAALRDARSADEATRARWRTEQQALAQAWRQAAADVAAGDDPVERALKAEWDELAYHIGERVRLRFAELFREAFHPGRLRPGAGRGALEEAAAELADAIARQLSSEVRTFALRVQRQTERALAEQRERMGRRMEEAHADLSRLPEPDPVPAAEAARAQISPQRASGAFRHFSNPKQFFEGNGAQLMLEELEGLFVPDARAEAVSLTEAVAAKVTAAYREIAAALYTGGAAALEDGAGAKPDAGADAQYAAWEAADTWFGNWLRDEA
ncbi:dynamin family protein [Alicyclobacillus sp.]|uniref:dynamin family protein n=1 Tax=Alicyclobacillus sp. TaxID=61169 RepID=UPI0025BF5A70|nr:dynamin family protein [Alicyclobacillus sp.]MCL6515682.1 dynamin family protein [Alicyclobacillus sp.]